MKSSGLEIASGFAARSPDPVLKTTLPKEAIKADGYFSQLHQFYLDAVVPLTAMIESADTGDLTVADAVTTVQSALILMGNMHQKWRKNDEIRCCCKIESRIESSRGGENLPECSTYMYALWRGIRQACHR